MLNHLTVSFYVKGNASATYVAELYDYDNNRTTSKTFSVTTDWTRIELSMGADTTGAFDDDNAVSLFLNIWLHGGSNYTGGTLNTSWNAVTQANRAVGISSFFDSTDRTFFITGVQVEVGQNQTEFEVEPFGVLKKNAIDIFTNTTNQHYGSYGEYNAAGYTDIQFPTDMRAVPTATKGSGSQTIQNRSIRRVDIYVVNAYPSMPDDSTFDAEL